MSGRKTRASKRGVSLRTLLVGFTTALIAGIMLIGLVFGSRSVSPAAMQTPLQGLVMVGDPAPPFSVTTSQGPFSLARSPRPTLLEVFATWCPHCQRETKVLNQLYDEYGDQISIVAVSGSEYAADRTSPESLADVLGFAQYFQVRYPIAFDESLAVEKAYLQSGYPTIVIVGSDKRIRYLNSGEIPKAQLVEAIRGVLRGR